MKSNLIRTFGTRRTMLTAGLALLAGAIVTSVMLTLAAPSYRFKSIETAARNVGDVERGTMHVKTADQRDAVIHFWQPRSAKATEVKFEQQGQRVFVRAVPRNPSGR